MGFKSSLPFYSSVCSLCRCPFVCLPSTDADGFLIGGSIDYFKTELIASALTVLLQRNEDRQNSVRLKLKPKPQSSARCGKVNTHQWFQLDEHIAPNEVDSVVNVCRCALALNMNIAHTPSPSTTLHYCQTACYSLTVTTARRRLNRQKKRYTSSLADGNSSVQSVP